MTLNSIMGSTFNLNRGMRTLLLISLLASGVSHATTDGRQIIQDNCRGCHGTHGKAKSESWPNLNCQNRGYLYARLIALKRNKDHDIDKKVQSLSITEIDEISRHYAEQKCSTR